MNGPWVGPCSPSFHFLLAEKNSTLTTKSQELNSKISNFLFFPLFLRLDVLCLKNVYSWTDIELDRMERLVKYRLIWAT